MERPSEFIRRVSTCLQERERPKLEAIAKQLEEYGRTVMVKPTPAMIKALAEEGIYLTEGDKLFVAEPFLRPSDQKPSSTLVGGVTDGG